MEEESREEVDGTEDVILMDFGNRIESIQDCDGNKGV